MPRHYSLGSRYNEVVNSAYYYAEDYELQRCLV